MAVIAVLGAGLGGVLAAYEIKAGRPRGAERSACAASRH